jgi:hypothetical protein
MKAKRLIFLLVLCICILGANRSYGDNFLPNPDVWVAVRFLDQGPGQPVDEYYGTVPMMTLNAVGSSGSTGFLKLSHVSVMTGGNLAPLSQVSADGSSLGYGDTMYIRVDTIFRIVEVDPGFVKLRLTPPAGK